jgi:lipopolysaccharide transport system ATP-binding protein
MRPAIRVDKLSKQYRLGTGRQSPDGQLREVLSDGVKRLVGRMWGRKPDPNGARPAGDGGFWALKDVSFEVQPGEVVGIIGRNGAGKSTLLKILSQIVEPTSGRAEVRGRMGSLLEVGTGFHPELTGRENIYLNGSILGMARREIDRKFDEIVAFSEIEQFLDTPVKRYSSGMYVRLAFAVAAHLEPDVLVVDEVLAVGDTEFQKKCMGKMQDVGRHGRTVLFVSHNMYAVAKLTTQAILVERGRVVAHGDTPGVIKKYLVSEGELAAEWVRPGPRPADRDVAFTAVRCVNAAGHPTAHFDADKPFALEFEFVVRREVDVQIAFRLNRGTDAGTVFTSALPDRLGQFSSRIGPGRYRSRCHVPAHLLVPGTYHLLVAANNQKGAQFDLLEQVLEFEVTPVGSLTCIEGRLGEVAPLLPWELLPEGHA